MKKELQNKLIRFGRENDPPALIAEMPVFGQRRVVQVSRNAMFNHAMDNFELTYMISGSLEWIINGELIITRRHDILITHPHDHLAMANNSISISDAFFLQLDLHERTQSPWPKPMRESLRRQLIGRSSRLLSPGPDCRHLLDKMITEHQQPDSFSAELCRGFLFELISLCLRVSSRQSVSQQPLTSDEIFAREVAEFLHQQMANKIKIDELAKKFSYSESHFRLLFQQAFQMSPVEFIRLMRLHQAQQLMRKRQLNLSEIAQRCGFSSSQYFSQVFHQQMGVSPREYRQALLKGSSTKLMHNHVYLMDMHFPDKN